MELILRKRCGGKTCDLVLMSARTGIPIVSVFGGEIRHVAERLGVKIPMPISWCEWERMDKKPKKIYIDESNVVLRRLLGAEVVAMTANIDDGYTLKTGDGRHLEGIRNVMLYLGANLIASKFIDRCAYRRKEWNDIAKEVDYWPDGVKYIIWDLWESGYIECDFTADPSNRTDILSKTRYVCGITSKGHKLLGKLRDDDIWKEIKSKCENADTYKPSQVAEAAFCI